MESWILKIFSIALDYIKSRIQSWNEDITFIYVIYLEPRQEYVIIYDNANSSFAIRRSQWLLQRDGEIPESQVSIIKRITKSRPVVFYNIFYKLFNAKKLELNLGG